jgi:hypothetical protein
VLHSISEAVAESPDYALRGPLRVLHLYLLGVEGVLVVDELLRDAGLAVERVPAVEGLAPKEVMPNFRVGPSARSSSRLRLVPGYLIDHFRGPEYCEKSLEQRLSL